jgi:hypothetical protein
MGLLGSLSVAFILGITLTTLISYDPAKHTGLQTGFLVAHILVAVGVVIGGIARLVLALKWHSLQLFSLLGLVSSLAAFVSGGIAAGNGNNVAVFVMALCFLISFVLYGYSLLTIRHLES